MASSHDKFALCSILESCKILEFCLPCLDWHRKDRAWIFTRTLRRFHEPTIRQRIAEFPTNSRFSLHWNCTSHYCNGETFLNRLCVASLIMNHVCVTGGADTSDLLSDWSAVDWIQVVSHVNIAGVNAQHTAPLSCQTNASLYVYARWIFVMS